MAAKKEGRSKIKKKYKKKPVNQYGHMQNKKNIFVKEMAEVAEGITFEAERLEINKLQNCEDLEWLRNVLRNLKKRKSELEKLIQKVAEVDLLIERISLLAEELHKCVGVPLNKEEALESDD